MTHMNQPNILVIGAGSWGTAVAIHLARHNPIVTLWGHSLSHIETMTATRCNERYLPKVHFPPNLVLTHDLNKALTVASEILIAVPSHAFESIIETYLKDLPIKKLAWLTKGLCPKTAKPLHDIACAHLNELSAFAVISGPSFAAEVGKGLPTAIVIACNQLSYGKHWQSLLHHATFRTYLTEDYLGVQLAGTMKNILAIATGISDGLGYGANARAALITRGLSEMQLLGSVLGASPTTFSGLSGLGDLILTCTDNQSRNRRFGLAIGQGASIKEALKIVGQVVEGHQNTALVRTLSKQYKLELPITEAVYNIIEQNITPKASVTQLFNRPLKHKE